MSDNNNCNCCKDDVEKFKKVFLESFTPENTTLNPRKLKNKAKRERRKLRGKK